MATVGLLLAAATASPAGAIGPKAPPPLAPASADGLSRALAGGRVDTARYALERAVSLFDPAAVRARFPGTARPDRRSATLVLRDLAARLGELGPAERARAERLLARPTSRAESPPAASYSVPDAKLCDAHLCIHWVETTDDAPPGADGDPTTIPAWVEQTMAVFQVVWAKEVEELGYRPPKSDLSSPENGGDGRLDVYLADIGDFAYGYCATDDPNAGPDSDYDYYDVSAFCVLDDDFSASQFAGPTNGEAALRVTAAHEFFHAVQFAYDVLEDTWLMEGTATWVEDEVFDEIDDNRQFLSASPLTQPSMPLDVSFEPYHYGAWIFWRFLSESQGAESVLAVWRLADGSPAGPDRYSLQAVRAVSSSRGLPFRSLFGAFAAANRIPASRYEEGAAYPVPPTARAWTLGALRGTTGRRAERLDHLTSRYLSFRPGPSLRAGARLRLRLELPPLGTGSAASLVVVPVKGRPRIRSVTLTSSGNAVVRAAFGRGKIRRVVLVLSNGSTRLGECWLLSTPFSCSGIPRDERRPYVFQARVSS